MKIEGYKTGISGNEKEDRNVKIQGIRKVFE